MTHARLLATAALVAGCVDAEQLDSDSAELAISFQIDASPGAMLLGSSADTRWIAYGTECEAGDDRTRLELYDTLTTRTTRLASGLPCQPGALVFSPDGSLVAFGDGQGHLSVHDARGHRTVSVSRDGLSTIGIVFSPSSQWFVVASADPEQPLGATLDAWDANLMTHVTVADHAFFSPFGPGPANIEFSPDGSRLLYLDALTGFPPVGNLTVWQRATGTSRVLATDVPAGSYATRADWKYVAYLRDATATAPDSPEMVGTLVVRNLVTDQTRTLETAKIARPLGYAGDTLLYGVYASTLPGTPIELRAHDVRYTATSTVDTGVFAGFGPNAIAISPDGKRVAYTRNLDSMTFSAELRVARAASPGTAQTIARRVVPFNAYGWLDGGRTLAFLHDATSTFPGAGMGTLSAWDAVAGGVVDIGSAVTQIGLAFDGAASELLYVGDYDMGMAAGDLRAWSARTGATRLLGRDAAVISVQRSPDRRSAGYLQLRPDPSGENPPRTALRVSRIVGAPRTVPVAADVTSFALGNHGRVVYATSAGVFDAVVF